MVNDKSQEFYSQVLTRKIVGKIKTKNFAPIFTTPYNTTIQVGSTQDIFKFELPYILDINQGDELYVKIKKMEKFMRFDSNTKVIFIKRSEMSEEQLDKNYTVSIWLAD